MYSTCNIKTDCLALGFLLRLGENWFRISRYIYDCNRPLAPILRQSRCSLMYDVYLTCIDDDEQVLHVQQNQNTWNTIRDQNWIFLFWTMNNEQAKNQMKQKSNKRQTKTQWKSNNNYKSTRYNWHMSTIHNINKSRVSLLKQVEMWQSRHCTELKISLWLRN
jgi:hypothetical protein